MPGNHLCYKLGSQSSTLQHWKNTIKLTPEILHSSNINIEKDLHVYTFKNFVHQNQNLFKELVLAT